MHFNKMGLKSLFKKLFKKKESKQKVEENKEQEPTQMVDVNERNITPNDFLVDEGNK